jgi:hypothetical protein
MTCFGDDLPSLNLDGMESIFPAPPEAARNVEIGLPDDQVLIRTPTARKFTNAVDTANYAKSITALPAAGETWHVIAKGNWPAWALVPRMLELAAPATINWLGIATLGFSKANVDELSGMLDSRAVQTVDLIYSCYFRSNEQTLVGYLTAEMQRRGQRIKAIRNHAKIIAAELSDGRAIVVESSANLRSCRNVENFCITNDAGLLAFHRQWMSTILSDEREHK